jgi:pimeloyl-ACP methyl ester carboxylesterase
MNTEINIHDLSLTTGGSGPPAVFIHGFGCSKFTWRHVCQGVQDTITYYAIDLPGSGTSPAPKEFHYTLENFSDVITEFIVSKNLKSVMLVGTSLGGGIILLALLRNANQLARRIKSLCIVDGIAYPQKFPFFVGLPRIPLLGRLLANVLPLRTQAKIALRYCYFDERLITTEQIEEYAGYLRRKEVRDALLRTAQLIDSDRLSGYLPYLKTIEIPCLLVWGREDRVVPLYIGEQLARELPNSKIVTIECCGHMPQEECPSSVIAALREFAIATN